jgi:hypothetical protein
MKKVAVSLFHFFDKSGCGTIAFPDLLRAMIPEANKKQISKMMKWV